MGRRSRVQVVALALFAGLVAAGAAHAIALSSKSGGHTVQRPLADFLNAQGTSSLFVPPVPDYVGWSDNPPNGCNSTRFALVDYAGIAAQWLAANGGPHLGTRLSGTVTERTLADGRADVSVEIHTSNALSWALQFPVNDLGSDPPIYGYRAQALAVNPSLVPALSDAHFQVEFINTAPGAPLPDVVTAFILGEAAPGQELERLSFHSSGTGTLHAVYGVPEGTPGAMNVDETGLIGHTFQGCPGDAFPVEHIDVRATGAATFRANVPAASLTGTPASPAPARFTWGRLQTIYR